MDPLSITASVIAVLQATNAVISVCYEFKAIIKDGRSGLSRVLEEVKDLRTVLENLERVTSRAEKENEATEILPTLKLLCKVDQGPLDLCLKNLNFLRQKLTPPGWIGQGVSKRSALAQAISWKWKETDITKLLQDLERCKSTLSLAITADEAALLLAIHDLTYQSTSQINDLNETMTAMFQSFQLRTLDEKQKKLLQWLSQADFYSSHEAAMKAHQHDTSNWFIASDEFTKWYGGDQSVLWLSGFPGSGKTILFSATIKHIQSNPSSRHSGLAFFYCDFRRAESRDPLNVIGSIVAQLCSKIGWIPEELESYFDKITAVPGQERRIDLSTLQQALTSIAQEHQIFILIDALDECDTKENILALIKDLEKQKLKLNILLTSRNERDIQDELQTSTRLRIESRLIEMTEDINSYVTTRIDHDRRLRHLNPAIRKNIQDVLNSRAKGMFRWVQCQFDQISVLRTPRAIREALDTLPESLNETYENILIKIPAQEMKAVRKILQWLAFNLISLSLKQVHEAIAIEPGTSQIDDESRLISPSDIIDLCGSLVAVSDHGFVTLAHLSVKEYLLSRSIQESKVSNFALVADDAIFDIAVSCLTYLSFEEFASGPATSNTLFEERLQRHPLLKHAAVAWTYYVRQIGQPQRLDDLVYRFFSPLLTNNFMSWVQVLSARRRAGNSGWRDFNPDATPLYYAASFGLDNIVRALINDGVDINAPGGRVGATAFHAASMRSHFETMIILLEAGADINKRDFIEVAPLDNAASEGSVEVIKFLLEHGAKIDQVGRKGLTAFQWATRTENSEAAAFLFDWAREHGLEEELVPISDEERRVSAFV